MPRQPDVALGAPTVDAAGFVLDRPRPAHAAKLLGHSEAGLQPVFVKAGAKVGAAEPGVAHALQRPKPFLRSHRRGVEQRMIVVGLVENGFRASARCAD